MTTSRLLSPFTFPRTGRTVPNRVVLAAMTNMQSEPDGTLGPDELAFLESRAAGGFGLITTCAAHVTPKGQGFVGQLGLFDDAHVAGLSKIADAVHAHGGLVIAQPFHAGVRAPSSLTGVQPLSASAFTLDAPKFEAPRAATVAEIEQLIEDFANAARRCAAAGLDGVELHGAHGYLLAQFLGTVTNTREDDWGGTLENRARFVRRVFSAARNATPSSFLVGVRLSPEDADQGLDFHDALQVAKWLTEDGVDFIHASHWDSYAKPAAEPDTDAPLTTWYRNAIGTDVPLIATGAINTPAQADEVLAQGADMIGLARAALGNAGWPNDAANASWAPATPPHTAQHLRDQGLGETFIDYMRRWPGFVSDDP